jgi:hypothetical protein
LTGILLSHCYDARVPVNSSPYPADTLIVGGFSSCLHEPSALPRKERRPFLNLSFSGGQLTYLGFAGLIFTWLWRLCVNWACWGDLSIDCGRELYVAAMLARGKMLYRDVWYLYHPGAPYFNGLLLRIFGVHVEVFYVAGSFAALLAACFLYLTGIRLSAKLAGWTAGVVVILEAFARQLFSFPLPYSFASVYGCLVACLYLWLLVGVCQSANILWLFALGCSSAAAMLLKMEFGVACYSILALLLVARAFSERSWARLAKDAVTVLPGVVACAAVAIWMVSIGGLDFLLKENLATWPSSFFMRTYGKFWLEHTGFDFGRSSLLAAMMHSLIFGCWLLAVYAIFFWKARGMRPMLYRMALPLTVLALIAGMNNLPGMGPLMSSDIVRFLFFPPDLVLYVAVAALVTGCLFVRDRKSSRKLALTMLFSFSSLLAFRILLHTTPTDYPIYYSGPAIFSSLVLLSLAVRHFSATNAGKVRAEMGICAACLFAVGLCVFPVGIPSQFREALVTPFGVVRADSATVRNYSAAIAFVRDKNSKGESVLSVPESTSLYFFAGVEAPLRVYTFTPGIVAPGPMTDKICASLEARPPQYLLWSNRIFPEYQALSFGKDFDRPLGDYLTAHYHRLGFLPPHAGSYTDWQVAVWQRNSSAARP